MDHQKSLGFTRNNSIDEKKLRKDNFESTKKKSSEKREPQKSILFQ